MKPRPVELGEDPRFEEMWEGATRTMLANYSDEGFVSDDYARELTAARTQAIEVERLSDDPPERLAEWLGTISDRALRELDLSLTLDLLRIEAKPDAWTPIAVIAAKELEQRTMTGELGAAVQVAESLAATASGDRRELRQPADRLLEQLANSPFTRHVTGLLRKASEADGAAIARLCHTIGPVMVQALAEALATEDHVHTIRRLKDLLIGFGAAGRQAVEPLQATRTNPAVRRTAIDLLRVFGGNDALRELAAMLSDADPQVQHDSIRAIVQIGTREAYAVLERACGADDRTRTVVVAELVSLRDPKTIPPLCHVLTTSRSPAPRPRSTRPSSRRWPACAPIPTRRRPCGRRCIAAPGGRRCEPPGSGRPRPGACGVWARPRPGPYWKTRHGPADAACARPRPWSSRRSVR